MARWWTMLAALALVALATTSALGAQLPGGRMLALGVQPATAGCSTIHLVVWSPGFGSTLMHSEVLPADVGAPSVCGHEAHTYEELTLRGHGCATASMWLSPAALPGAEVCHDTGAAATWTFSGHAAFYERLGFGYSYGWVDAEYGMLSTGLPFP